nr:MAG TPA: hypothetical protein [Caudoviricetes sp.]
MMIISSDLRKDTKVKKMNKEKIEELVKQFGLREVVRVNNIIAKEKSYLENVVYFAEEFDTFCKGVQPSAVARLVSTGYDLETFGNFSFSDCIIFSIDWFGDLEVATTKKGVVALLTRTLEFVGYEEFLQLVNKDYVEKF